MDRRDFALALLACCCALGQNNPPPGAGPAVQDLQILPLLPLGPWGPHVPFPDVKSMKTLRITLARAGCFGHCPDYTVEVRGDGAVQFAGRRDVRALGNHHRRISRDAVAELLAEFRRADFLSLRDALGGYVMDSPVYTVSIEFDGRKKSVHHSEKVSGGIPEVVTDLEKAIDRLAATGKWIGKTAPQASLRLSTVRDARRATAAGNLA